MKEKLEQLIDDMGKNGDLAFMANLANRWIDEHKYESFSEYEKVIRARFRTLDIKKVTKRPFGIEIVSPYGDGVMICIKYAKRGNYFHLQLSVKK